MRLVYIILFHKNPDQLIRLINRLSHTNVSFVIHVDTKVSRNVMADLIARLADKECIYFIKKRVPIFYFDFSMVQATLNCIDFLFDEKIVFDYACLISESHYPLKQPDDILSYLQHHAGREFIECITLPREDGFWYREGGGVHRFIRWHIRLFGSIFLNFPSKIILPFFARVAPYKKLVGGSQWWCLSREFLSYLRDLCQQNNHIVQFFRYAGCPDEIFFQSIIANSPYSDKISYDNLLHVTWDSFDSSHPCIFTLKDLPQIIGCNKLFARKFDIFRDKDILDSIDMHLGCNVDVSRDTQSP